jgi:hypothetical protein
VPKIRQVRRGIPVRRPVLASTRVRTPLLL